MYAALHPPPKLLWQFQRQLVDVFEQLDVIGVEYRTLRQLVTRRPLFNFHSQNSVLGTLFFGIRDIVLDI